jgi:molybdopterin converting factor small subunit
MTTLRLPTPLRPYADGAQEIALEGQTVGAALGQLVVRYPALRGHLYDESGSLRPYVNIFLNEDDVRGLEGETTPLAEGDRLMIIPSIAGGLSIGRSTPCPKH